MVSFAIVLLGLGNTLKLTAQTRDVSVAKQHYANAVAAIANNDWAKARSELIQAKQLAPRNALISYDLALAYKHTGQLRSARAELNRALQLGLPAGQKQDAESLKQQLEDSSTGGADSKPRAKVDVQYDRFKDSTTATLILDFPKEQVAIQFSTSCKGQDFSTQWHNPLFSLRKGKGDWTTSASEAVFLADGASIQLPTQVINGDSAVPVYLLRDLSRAKAIEGRLDGTEVVFTADQITSIQEFIDKVHLQFEGPLWDVPASTDALNAYGNSVMPRYPDDTKDHVERSFSASRGVVNLSSSFETSPGNGHYSTSVITLSQFGMPPDYNMLLCLKRYPGCQVVRDSTDGPLEFPGIFPGTIHLALLIQLHSPEERKLVDAVIYAWYLSQFRAM